jgi:hypothetical protein
VAVVVDHILILDLEQDDLVDLVVEEQYPNLVWVVLVAQEILRVHHHRKETMVVMQTMVRLDHLVILVGEAEVLVLLDQMDQQVVLAETEPHQQLLAHQQHMLAAVVREIT